MIGETAGFLRRHAMLASGQNLSNGLQRTPWFETTDFTVSGPSPQLFGLNKRKSVRGQKHSLCLLLFSGLKLDYQGSTSIGSCPIVANTRLGTTNGILTCILTWVFNKA